MKVELDFLIFSLFPTLFSCSLSAFCVLCPVPFRFRVGCGWGRGQGRQHVTISYIFVMYWPPPPSSPSIYLSLSSPFVSYSSSQ
uniref:Uncharacterized protein n=1 Tax=Caenorhabditis japonica TaxID=281687 RepID=A0A8R1IMT2_CAEJA